MNDAEIDNVEALFNKRDRLEALRDRAAVNDLGIERMLNDGIDEIDRQLGEIDARIRVQTEEPPP